MFRTVVASGYQARTGPGENFFDRVVVEGSLVQFALDEFQCPRLKTEYIWQCRVRADVRSLRMRSPGRSFSLASRASPPNWENCSCSVTIRLCICEYQLLRFKPHMRAVRQTHACTRQTALYRSLHLYQQNDTPGQHARACRNRRANAGVGKMALQAVEHNNCLHADWKPDCSHCRSFPFSLQKVRHAPMLLQPSGIWQAHSVGLISNVEERYTPRRRHLTKCSLRPCRRHLPVPRPRPRVQLPLQARPRQPELL